MGPAGHPSGPCGGDSGVLGCGEVTSLVVRDCLFGTAGGFLGKGGSGSGRRVAISGGMERGSGSEGQARDQNSRARRRSAVDAGADGWLEPMSCRREDVMVRLGRLAYAQLSQRRSRSESESVVR